MQAQYDMEKLRVERKTCYYWLGSIMLLAVVGVEVL